VTRKLNISEEENTQRIERLHALREMSGLKKKDFVKLLGRTYRVLNLWETGRIPLSKNSISLIIKSLEKVGVFCSEEWFLFGRGRAPVSGQHASLDNIDTDATYSTSSLISFYERFYPDVLHCLIEDYRYDPRIMPTTLLIGAGTSQDQFNKDWGYGYLYHLNKKQVIPIDIQLREDKLWGIPFAQMNYSADPFLIAPEERIYPIINIRPLFSRQAIHTHQKIAA